MVELQLEDLKYRIKKSCLRLTIRSFGKLIFPDIKYNGSIVNPKTLEVFSFEETVLRDEKGPFHFIENHATYYPDSRRSSCEEKYAIFVPGLGQPIKEACSRSRRYAERMEITGITNMHNSSYVNGIIFSGKNGEKLDFVNAFLHYTGIRGSPVIDNLCYLILDAIVRRVHLNLGCDSHGTILVGRALQDAKDKFCRFSSESEWDKLTYEYIFVIVFGNSYRKWVRGPKYIFCYIQGDQLPEKGGWTEEKYKESIQKNKKNDVGIQFLVFERMFADDFEAHNMMYTIELLKQSMIQNRIDINDFNELYHQLKNGTFKKVTAEQAMSGSFPWPLDIINFTWVPSAKPVAKLLHIIGWS